jgi:predicted NAD-dependent protein-ADP-ribosyltransferase YbiA (DUF1768 family)
MNVVQINKNPLKMTRPEKSSGIDKLYFYSKSRDVYPGKGANEQVKDESLYAELSAFKDFRRILSNFHVCPFKFEDLTYNSIEHAFQAKKIELVDPEKAKWFTTESGHKIGQGDGSMAQKNRKLVVLPPADLKKWNQSKMQIMKRISIAKYFECEEAKKVLLATKQAQLWHIVSRKPAMRFVHLEEIRTMLLNC